MTNPSGNPAPKPPLTASGIALIAIGALLLLVPGGCALYGLYAGLILMTSGVASGPTIGVVVLLITVVLGLLAFFGFSLIRVGRRRRRWSQALS